jgi:hypothetical protein
MEMKWEMIRKVKPSILVNLIISLFVFSQADFLRGFNTIIEYLKNLKREGISFIYYKY